MPSDAQELFAEASCFNCFSNATTSDLLKLALLDRILAVAADASPGGADGAVQYNNGGVFGGFGSFNDGTSVLTIPGDLLFASDNADDIGASGATRPRRGYFGTELLAPLVSIAAAANAKALAVTGYSLTAANTQSMLSLAGTWNTTGIPTAVDLNITDTASNTASLLMQLRNGATNRFSVGRLGTGTFSSKLRANWSSTITPVFDNGGLQVECATNNGITLLTTASTNTVNCFDIMTTAARLCAVAYDGTNTLLDFQTAVAGGTIRFRTAAGVEAMRLTSTGLMTFAGTTSSFPALKRSTTILQTRLADDSAYAAFEANTIRTATAYTVATLPAAGTAGRRAYVTDALAPAYGAAVAAGGAVVTPVFDTSVAWVVG